MKNKLNFKRYRGMTLIEMMIVVSLITITTSIVILTYSSARGSNQLRVTQREVAATIKLAHSYALQGRAQTINDEQKAPCGYGFRFKSSTEYEIFYNFGNDCAVYNKDSDNRKFIATVSEAVSGDSYKFKNRVELQDWAAKKSVYFTVPHGGTAGTSGNFLSGSNNVTFTIESLLNKSTAEIRVESGGRVMEIAM